MFGQLRLYCRHAVYCQNYLRLLSISQHYQVSVCFISKKTYPWPELKEGDFDEEFMRGSGPGGQAVAKTNNCVVLTHKATGIRVKCHETRSQSENRQLARERLIYHLDIYYNKDLSFDAQKRREKTEINKEREKRSAKKLALKKEFKQREGLDKKAKDGVS